MFVKELGMDETENIRSVFMHKEEDPKFLKRFSVDLNMKIQKILKKLKQFYEIAVGKERRLRKKIYSSLIVKEEMKVHLKNYQEVSIRLKLKFGRFPTIKELASAVTLYENMNFHARFYFNKGNTIFEWKTKICKEFNFISQIQSLEDLNV